MKIVAYVGTPRKKGSINSMIDNILEGAKAKGAECQKFNLYDYEINPCRGCWAAAHTGKCPIVDDFNQLYKAHEESDVIILGSPVYWADVTGVVKNFIDRYTGWALWKPPEADKLKNLSKFQKIKKLLEFSRKFGPKNPEWRNKKYILVSSSTVPFRHLMGEYKATMKTMRTFVNKLGGKRAAELVYTDTLFKLNPKKHEKIMKKAYKIGENVVKL